MHTRITPGPWKVEVGVSSIGMGFNGIYHAIVKGGHSYTVAQTEEVTGEVVSESLGRGYVRERLVNRRKPQREPHPDVLLISAAPGMFAALTKLIWRLDHNQTIQIGDVKKARAALALATGQQESAR